MVHARVVAPTVTKSLRTAKEAAQRARPDLKVGFVEIDAGRSSIDCDFELQLAPLATVTAGGACVAISAARAAAA